MQAFSLDHGSGIPVKLQLKAHVKYQVLSGLLRPGDQLPPLRDLAAGLGVNLNTVLRAFHELEAEGYLYSHQGRGVFVADEFPGQGHGAALRSLLAGVMQPAREWGISPEEMALALMAHGQLARPPQAAPYRMLLVAGSRALLRRLQGELEAALPVVVEGALIEEVAEKARTSDFRVVASTLFHADEVARLLPRTKLVTLASEPARASYSQLHRLAPGTAVAVAARDLLQAARVRHSLEAIGLSSLRVEIAAGQTPSSLAPALAGVAFVLATSDSREIAREALAGRPEVLVLAEPVELPSEALNDIRKALGVPSTEQRVHIRSAWV